VVIILQLLVGCLQFALLTYFGLLFSEKTGFTIPLLNTYLDGESISSQLKSLLIPSLGLGVLAGVLIVGADIVSLKYLVISQPAVEDPGLWQGIMYCFFGGIGGEITWRLFGMSFIVWVLGTVSSRGNDPSVLIIIVSIVLASVLFGLLHVEFNNGFFTGNILSNLRIFLLNGVGGLFFGWLYWKKGLESAMIAHFSTDIILHVVAPCFR
jgi:membrane protease YdiL (CAAX protease family)